MRWNFLVAAQRHPWAASYAAMFGVSQLPAMVGGREFGVPRTSAALVVLATTLAAHLVAHAPSWTGRVSALVLGNLGAVLEYRRGSGFRFRDVCDMQVLVLLSTAAWAWSLLASRTVASRAGWLGVGLLGSFALGDWRLREPANLIGLAALPLAVGGVVASAAPLRRWALGAAALGVVVGLVGCFAVTRYGPRLEDLIEEPAGFAAAGLVLVLIGGIGRRARSMTVVPTDHPSIADFPRRPESSGGAGSRATG